MTLPGVRRVVDRALVMVAVGVFVAPAGATVVTVRDGRSGSERDGTDARPPPRAPTAPATPTRRSRCRPRSRHARRRPRPRRQPSSSLPGDNLWTLAADHLAAATGRARATLDDREIARLLGAVCDANRARVRSGNVSLIYPGEVIVLPALSCTA